ncbi:hypothetical protein RBU49_06620 [Clostridium sp. MB40-C1]|uniref:hypothetical protein n=1 Tax=Clostridium sp. MB40-C1 TaxID=3070996 RepID=UPI0027DF52B5|nr:hypothetical protein [Clostridium sp. MB40-C1]WMJ81915.1 hypothetical protein RBU49_06620 [Clostridium sp. MB40-C1]
MTKKKINQNVNHQIENIDKKHRQITSEEEFRIIGNNTELVDTHELGTNIESNPFAFSEEKKPFYKEDDEN